MIGYIANNEVADYSAIGFDKKLQKQPDGDSMGVHSTGYVDSIQFDSQFEGVDIGKLTSNQLRQTIKMGNISIDGKNNRIIISDGKNDQILIGYDRNGF